MEWALLINESRDMGDLLEDLVRGTLRDVQCVRVSNLEEGESALREWGLRTCVIVIAGLTAVVNAAQPQALARTNLTGLEFAARLREECKGKGPPVILLGAYQDTRRREQVSKVANVQLLVFGSDSLPDAINAALHGRGNASGTTAMARVVDLTIDLATKNWRLTGRGPGVPAFDDIGAINLRQEDLRNLSTLSKQLHGGTQERDFLNYVGGQIYRILMANAIESGDLESTLMKNVTRVGGGLDVARIGFNVNRQTHNILFEILAKPKDDALEPEFWLLKSPIFRKFEYVGSGYPLYKDRQSRRSRVDCLIIQGNVDDFTAAKPGLGRFARLANAAYEVDWLYEYLRDNKDRFNLGEICLLRYEAGATSFAATIRKTLEGHQWGLIHYAGHSAVESEESGYLVLGGEEEDLVNIRSFSEWARATQFVFLSSCQSAASYFLTQLVNVEIPAVVGYGWQVKDRVALSFAEQFYQNLFDENKGRPRFIEYAFMRAKQALHDSDPAHADWAAPFLIMQVRQAELDA